MIRYSEHSVIYQPCNCTFACSLLQTWQFTGIIIVTVYVQYIRKHAYSLCCSLFCSNLTVSYFVIRFFYIKIFSVEINICKYAFMYFDYYLCHFLHSFCLLHIKSLFNCHREAQLCKSVALITFCCRGVESFCRNMGSVTSTQAKISWNPLAGLVPALTNVRTGLSSSFGFLARDKRVCDFGQCKKLVACSVEVWPASLLKVMLN